jgi:hypothetical protein
MDSSVGGYYQLTSGSRLLNSQLMSCYAQSASSQLGVELSTRHSHNQKESDARKKIKAWRCGT